MNPTEKNLLINLETYVTIGIKQRYDAIEQVRSKCEEGCSFGRTSDLSSWDISFDALSDKVKKTVVKNAKNENEADILMNIIFAEIKINYASGGDHHIGYFQEYTVLTSDAVKFCEVISLEDKDYGDYLGGRSKACGTAYTPVFNPRPDQKYRGCRTCSNLSCPL